MKGLVDPQITPEEREGISIRVRAVSDKIMALMTGESAVDLTALAMATAAAMAAIIDSKSNDDTALDQMFDTYTDTLSDLVDKIAANVNGPLQQHPPDCGCDYQDPRMDQNSGFDYFALTFGDRSSKFLGACVVKATTFREAILRSKEIGINPGGGVVGTVIPTKTPPPENVVDILFDSHEKMRDAQVRWAALARAQASA